jgi:hypothetical protein
MTTVREPTDLPITWDDPWFPGEDIHTWQSIGAWVSDWWEGNRAQQVATQAEYEGQKDVPWPDSPAADLLSNMVDEGDPRTVSFIVALAEAATSEQESSDLGADDIETLLCHRDDGARFIDEVEAAARSSEMFARALSYMWVSKDVDPELGARLIALGAIDLALPGPLPR